MLYEWLPLLRGWKPDRHSTLAEPITTTTPFNVIDDQNPGWLHYFSFKASDSSCVMILTIDQETYEIKHIGSFEPPFPRPYKNHLKIDVKLLTTTTQPSAIFNAIGSRDRIIDKADFLASLNELFPSAGQLSLSGVEKYLKSMDDTLTTLNSKFQRLQALEKRLQALTGRRGI